MRSFILMLSLILSTLMGIAIFFLLLTRLLQKRREILQRQYTHIKKTPREFSHNLRPGDIVFMSSRNFSYTKPITYFTMWASLVMGPWFHVFVVLKDHRLAHFIPYPYHPQLERYCASRKPYLQVGDIYSFVSKRRDSLYLVLRRKDPVLFDDHLDCLCEYEFVDSLMTVFLNMIIHVLDPERHLTCTAYVGILLQNAGFLPQNIRDVNSEFTPNRLITIYLARLDYEIVGVYDIS